MGRLKSCLGALLVGSLALLSQPADAASIVSLYGDDDGFGIGATSGNLDPTVSNNSGDALLTDQGVIGDDFAGAGLPAFAPTGSFSAFAVPAGDVIAGASLTIRFGSWSNESPLDPPNRLFLDGVDLSALLSAFTANTGASFGGNAIETATILVPVGFWANLADGIVSLAGTHISEGLLAGTFQVDFLRLDITTRATTAVPEPASLALLGTALAGLGWLRRRRHL